MDRKSPETISQMALEWNPQGSRGRGQHKQTWRRSMLNELANANITCDGAKITAKNRIRCKSLVEALCSQEEWERKKNEEYISERSIEIAEEQILTSKQLSNAMCLLRKLCRSKIYWKILKFCRVMTHEKTNFNGNFMLNCRLIKPDLRVFLRNYTRTTKNFGYYETDSRVVPKKSEKNAFQRTFYMEVSF